MILIFQVASEEEFCSVNNKECMKNYDATESLKGNLTKKSLFTYICMHINNNYNILFIFYDFI